jgi:hypothetical protein
MTPTTPHLTLVAPSPTAAIVHPTPSSVSPADAPTPSLDVVLLLDVLARIEQRRQQRLRTLQTKAAS